MSYNLKKIAVGIKSIERLKIRQQMLFENYGAIVHTTRNMPKQKADLIKTGSMYWIIQRNVLVRQKILDITSVIRSDGSKGCEIILDKDLLSRHMSFLLASYNISIESVRYLNLLSIIPLITLRLETFIF